VEWKTGGAMMTLIIEISLALAFVVLVCVLLWLVWKLWKKQVDLASELVDIRKTIIALYETQKVLDKRWRDGK
jgi:hypothetical protein